MAESESSSQTGKAPKNKNYTASKLFNSLGFSKKQDTGKHTSSSNSKDGSVKTTQVTISYAPIPHQPDSSRHEGHSQYTTPRRSPVASSDEPPDQSLRLTSTVCFADCTLLLTKQPPLLGISLCCINVTNNMLIPS